MAKKSNNVSKKNDKKTEDKPKLTTRVKTFFTSLFKEIKLVVWPNRKTLKETTAVVLVVVAAVVLLVFVIDKAMIGVLDLMGFNTAPAVTSNTTTIASEVEETDAGETEEQEGTTNVTIDESSSATE